MKTCDIIFPQNYIYQNFDYLLIFINFHSFDLYHWKKCCNIIFNAMIILSNENLGQN